MSAANLGEKNLDASMLFSKFGNRRFYDIFGAVDILFALIGGPD